MPERPGAKERRPRQAVSPTAKGGDSRTPASRPRVAYQACRHLYLPLEKLVPACCLQNSQRAACQDTPHFPDEHSSRRAWPGPGAGAGTPPPWRNGLQALPQSLRRTAGSCRRAAGAGAPCSEARPDRPEARPGAASRRRATPPRRGLVGDARFRLTTGTAPSLRSSTSTRTATCPCFACVAPRSTISETSGSVRAAHLMRHSAEALHPLPPSPCNADRPRTRSTA